MSEKALAEGAIALRVALTKHLGVDWVTLEVKIIGQGPDDEHTLHLRITPEAAGKVMNDIKSALTLIKKLPS